MDYAVIGLSISVAFGRIILAINSTTRWVNFIAEECFPFESVNVVILNNDVGAQKLAAPHAAQASQIKTPRLLFAHTERPDRSKISAIASIWTA